MGTCQGVRACSYSCSNRTIHLLTKREKILLEQGLIKSDEEASSKKERPRSSCSGRLTNTQQVVNISESSSSLFYYGKETAAGSDAFLSSYARCYKKLNYLFQICFSQFTFFFITGINLKPRANEQESMHIKQLPFVTSQTLHYISSLRLEQEGPWSRVITSTMIDIISWLQTYLAKKNKIK